MRMSGASSTIRMVTGGGASALIGVRPCSQSRGRRCTIELLEALLEEPVAKALALCWGGKQHIRALAAVVVDVVPDARGRDDGRGGIVRNAVRRVDGGHARLTRGGDLLVDPAAA